MELSTLIQLEGHLPKQLELTNAIRSLIQKGELEPGYRLPSEERLSSDLKVSRKVVRTAYASLSTENWIKRFPKLGYMVQKEVVYTEFSTKFRTVSDEMKTAGLSPSFKLIERSVIEASKVEFNVFQNRGKQLKLIRLFYADDQPLLVMESYYPLELFPILEASDLDKEGVFPILKRVYGTEITKGRKSLHPMLMSQAMAKLLQVESQSACMFLESHVYDQHGQFIEFALTYAIGNRISLAL
jgi:GntR family transcriptional regulator